MGKDVEAEREKQREEEERRRRMADPVLAALPEGLQKRQQVRAEVASGWGRGACGQGPCWGASARACSTR